MPDGHNKSGLFAELKRRNVVRVAAAYIVIAWMATEIAAFLLEQTGAPGWGLRLLAIVFVVGFPLAVALAWIIQRQPGGGWSLDSSQGQGRAVLATVALGVLVTACLAWLILPRIEDVPPDYQPLPDSVAVLPLEVPDGIPGTRTIGTTVYDALTSGLAQSRELTQVQLKLKQPPEDLYAFGRKVRVKTLLAGRVIRVNGEIRVDMDLLDVGRGESRWSQSFDWDATRIMEIGTDISNGVLASLELPPMTTDRFAGTRNREAYDALLVGYSHFASWALEGLETAMESYHQAIELDPGFARAWLSLASAARVYAGMKGGTPDQRQAMTEQAREALDMALSLDDQSARAVSMLGRFTENRDLRVQLWKRALELDPTHGLTYFRLGWEEFLDGSLEEAARLMRKALDYSPMDANYRMDLARVLWDMGRDEEARREMRTAIGYQPDMSQPYLVMGRWARFYGHLDEAIILYHQSHVKDPQAGWIAGWLANSWANLGAEKEALDWLRLGEQLMPSGICSWAWGVHMNLGDIEAARESALEDLQIHPDNDYAVQYLARLDVDSGRADLALARWEAFSPGLLQAAGDLCHREYAYALLADGQQERARGFLLPCIEPPDQKEYRQIHYYVEQAITHALLGNRAETLHYLEKLVVDEGWRRIFDIEERREFDFLEGDPRFERLMVIMRNDLELQLERVRELARNGELDPVQP
jgi:serine/threonine-protein kinase